MLTRTQLVIICTACAVSGIASGQGDSTVASGTLNIGSSQKSIVAKYGKPFQRARITPQDDSARIGVRSGLWDVYHLTSQDRMYVTFLHFDSANGGQPTLDALMLEPNGHWSVSQTLNDQPEMKAICEKGCDVRRIVNEAGNDALLLEPSTQIGKDYVIYFDGDSATMQWKSVSSLNASPSWVYMLRAEDFKATHPGVHQQTIGQWSPETR